MLIFKLLVSLTKGNPSLARRPVLVSTLRDGKKVLQVSEGFKFKLVGLNVAIDFVGEVSGFYRTLSTPRVLEDTRPGDCVERDNSRITSPTIHHGRARALSDFSPGTKKSDVQ